EIIAPVFKSHHHQVAKKTDYIPQPALKLNIDNVQLTIFKGTNAHLATEVTKILIS
ncbi:hypothetical protein H5S09_00620, partial [Limosilactobacillus sp. STM2_1]|nr:hypothetical protein [Limosilactobacillus rudii]MBB1096484.1 hypothetical protein [Limosilactobacillus rudii]